MRENKGLIIIGLVTLLVFVGIGFYASKQEKKVGSPIDQSLLVREDSQSIKATDATVTLVEFSDFQCPGCAGAYLVVKELLKKYEGQVNFVYRNFPLPQHTFAMSAALSAEVTGDQGKFWEMHDMIFENQDIWAKSKTKDEAEKIFAEYATILGLDMNIFQKSINEEKYAEKINRDIADGKNLGINSTPTFYVNGAKLTITSYNDIEKAIQESLNQK